MSRIKHIIMIVFKVFFIILCFAVATSYSAIKSADLSALEEMKGKVGLDGCEILVFDTSFDETGTSLAYEVKDGKIIFDVTQSGREYDEVTVLISFPKYNNTPQQVKR